ncbi:MAG: hypothetical protein O9302_06400 [Cyclobacteriaceae bacterium]|jgi:hypothetical protein|nr:hypothetical protein [Flammeovirgaceae bacterium]MCZ8023534.1 hypothetical protein [Cytophagales bacterium]MCZ8327669.1 hypothetical protein [Cyclobacteriaceae bacterium]
MKRKSYSLIVPLAVATFIFQSCGSSGDKSNNSDEFKAAEESLKNQIEEVVYNIPSPSEIPYLLQATGAEFNQSLINANAKASTYATRNDKAALNLGVYAADIGYLSSYDKSQEAIDYLNSCKLLADNLGVIGSFDVEVLKKFESNISNKDSLAYLLNKTINQTESFLKNDSRNRLAALVLTGSFIEGLYISTGIVKTYPKNGLTDEQRNLVLTNLMRVILEQKKSVSELLKMLSTIDQSEPVAGLVTDLKTLEADYAALNIEEQIKSNKANLVLTDAKLVSITSVVEKIRKGIVE